MKKLNDHAIDAMIYAHDRLGFLENCVGGNEKEILSEIKIHKEYLKILEGEKDGKNRLQYRKRSFTRRFIDLFKRSKNK